MKSYCIATFVIIVAIIGCTQTKKVDVHIPEASSGILNVRRNQYEEIDRKYTHETIASDEENNYSSGSDATSTALSPTNTNLNKFNQAYAYQQAGSPPHKVEQGRRLAIVIGNSDYIYGGRLSNPLNDAAAMAESLEKLGFKVNKHLNASQREMKRAIDTFGENLREYDVGLFFYAGHGIQVKGYNYLIPTDAKILTKNDVEYNAINAGRVLAKMEDAGNKTNIIILDACRDNPFERSWSRGIKGKGLAFMNAPSGSFITYATSPGHTASDGKGKNGVYTSAILQHMGTSNITIEEMFKRVRLTVEGRTKNTQTPWESTSLKGNFYFKYE